MQNEMIDKAARLMDEQTASYTRLQSATAQLTAALVKGEPEAIESLSRAGESELMRMRARLLEIISVLTDFSNARAQETEKTSLETAIREKFDATAKLLIEAARAFLAVSLRCQSLALGGSAFSQACLQAAGVPAATYRAPVLKYAEASR